MTSAGGRRQADSGRGMTPMAKEFEKTRSRGENRDNRQGEEDGRSVDRTRRGTDGGHQWFPLRGSDGSEETFKKRTDSGGQKRNGRAVKRRPDRSDRSARGGASQASSDTRQRHRLFPRPAGGGGIQADRRDPEKAQDPFSPDEWRKRDDGYLRKD